MTHGAFRRDRRDKPSQQTQRPAPGELIGRASPLPYDPIPPPAARATRPWTRPFQDADLRSRASTAHRRPPTTSVVSWVAHSFPPVKPAVQRRRAKEIGEAVPVEPLNGRVPAHDRATEWAAGIVDQSPTLVGAAHVVLEWRMTPVGVAGENRSCRSAVSAYTSRSPGRRTTTLPSSAIQPPGRSTSCARPPADRRVDPVPRRRGREHVEASTRVVPLLERRRLNVDVAEGSEPLASKRGHARAGLDRGHRTSQSRQRARRLTGTAAHLKRRRPSVHAGDDDEVRKRLVGVYPGRTWS